ncbi:MAG: site-specific integrase [Acetobacteraceae bacterium]|nr:site-specific integrase [Acetobacteraceae bacterium]
MPRKARDERLDTRTARFKLPVQREPHWRTIQEGRAIGYRRVGSGRAGTWIARHYDSSLRRRQYEALGTADDFLNADGASTLTFAQAQEKAAVWFRDVERRGGRTVEPITVEEALDAYVADYLARGGKAERDTRAAINAHILPQLGQRRVADLTYVTLRDWHRKLATVPARLRSTTTQANTRTAETEDAKRARRATANRVLTVLKAAFSLAYREGRVPSDDAWRRVKPFPNVEAARVRYLTDSEAIRLVKFCSADFRQLVTAALLTGCRYGELSSLRAADFDPDAGVLHIRKTKAGRPRAVPLSDEAIRFFTSTVADKSATATMLTRGEAATWGRSWQFRPLREACAAAKIIPAISFHVLRHTFASRLAMKRVPMSVIAAALGNSEAICAKHYAHLAPGYVSDTIREAAGDLGIVEPQVAVPLRHRAVSE